MFRLEKLEISGFKSFADKTSLIFREGITSVVGPNGCGKSNIAEAISWVLGEQSAKNLRGGKMEDVIFNGTRDRKPTGLAEVTLTLVAVKDVAGRDPDDDRLAEDLSRYDRAIEGADEAAIKARVLVEENRARDGETDAAPVQGDTPASSDEQPAGPQRESPVIRPPRRRKPTLIKIAAGDRITVGRRLYRTGDSDYLINGRQSLLRDVQDLFAGTGLGGAHYAIIEQGRIGQILSSKPLDRRGLIEEAAGITRFKTRKRAAELKLESARQNLTRLNDIISEVERQVNSLKRQAQKARRYRRLRDELRSLLKVVFAADYYRLSESAVRVARELESAGAEQKRLDQLVGEREAEHRTVSVQAREAEDALSGLKEHMASLELEADRTRNRAVFDEQQRGQLSARIEEMTREQTALEERLALLETESHRRSGDCRALESELIAEQAKLHEQETEYQSRMTTVREAEGALEELRQQLLVETGLTERLRNLRSSLEESLRKLDLRKTALVSERERAVGRRGETAEEHTRLGASVESERARLVELASSIDRSKSGLRALRNEGEILKTALETAQAERASAEHRLASLEELDEHRAYYSDAVQEVFSPEQAARINAIGTLADFVNVEPQYERLVESLLGRELQCVLVPTIDDALTGVEFIKREDLGRGGFLVVGLHGAEGDSGHDPENFPTGGGASAADLSNDAASRDRQDEMSGSETSQPDARTEGGEFRLFNPEADAHPEPRFTLEPLRAIDLLGLRPEIRAVVERAFPDKSTALIVPDMEAALHLSIENQTRIYVTYVGEQVVNGRLIVTGGTGDRKGASLLALKREIRELRGQAQALLERERDAATEFNLLSERISRHEVELAAIDQETRECERSIAAQASQLDALLRELERAGQHVRVVDAELAQLESEREELSERVAQLGTECEAAEASRAATLQSLNDRQAALAELKASAEQFSELISSARASVAARVERAQAARAELRRLQNEAEEVRSRLSRNRLELYDAHGRIEQLTASLAEAEGAAERFERQREELAARVGEASETLTGMRARSDELETLLSRLRHEAAAAHDRRGQIEVEQARIESEAEHLARTCHSELAMSIQDVVTSVELARSGGDATTGDSLSEMGSISETGSAGEAVTAAPHGIEESRARLDEVRAKLDDMGPVNMMALEELEESETRLGFLTEQRRDILDSIKSTEEALAEIKRRSRERFLHAFTNINRNFQQMFVELFGGGRGEMILLDETDVLESGIDIIAQPPGKRLQNVLLLSGGEKAMAAISLVLAIFQYKPSPFCILDEVDAPLDEMNVGRFADKVIEMSTDTQFLVITHNKRTMEASRALYGVTMEEPGVSKLVSVKFD